MSEVWDPFLPEEALLLLSVKLVFPHFLEYLPEMFHMLLFRVTEDCQVVDVDCRELADEVLEHLVHCSLERCWCSLETKGHYLPLVLFPFDSWYTERRDFLGIFCHGDLVVPTR